MRDDFGINYMIGTQELQLEGFSQFTAKIMSNQSIKYSSNLPKTKIAEHYLWRNSR